MKPHSRYLSLSLLATLMLPTPASLADGEGRGDAQVIASARFAVDWRTPGARSQAEWLSQAQFLERRGDWARLLDWGRGWTQAEPANGLAWFVLGRALAMLQRYPEAIMAYQQSLRADPGDVHAHNNLGNVYRYGRRNQEALRAYREAVRINPDYVPAWHNLGITIFDLRGIAGVARALQQLHASDPALAAAWSSLALDYSRSRDERVTRDAILLLRGLSDAQRERMFAILLGDG